MKAEAPIATIELIPTSLPASKHFAAMLRTPAGDVPLTALDLLHIRWMASTAVSAVAERMNIHLQEA
jgi:hypothetical protein